MKQKVVIVIYNMVNLLLSDTASQSVSQYAAFIL